MPLVPKLKTLLMMKKHGAESLICVINKRTRIFNIVLLFYDTYAAIKKVSIFNKSQKNNKYFDEKKKEFFHINLY